MGKWCQGLSLFQSISMTLNDKIVMVTGSSSGIGQATAIAFAREEAKVIIHYNKGKDGADATANEISKLGQSAFIVQADLTQKTEVDNLFKQIKEKYGRIDVLVNNAGGTIDQPDPLDIDVWCATFEKNLFSVIMCCEAVVGLMADGGKIVNVSSMYGNSHAGSKVFPAYSAAKAAVNSLTQTLSKVYSPKILVNAVAPGYTTTPAWGEMSQEDIETYSKRKLIERYITPEEVADAILFLTKNDAMAGEVLTIDGGLSLKTV